MKRPAIFFDRDNTIIISDGYLGDPEKVVLMDGAAEAVARARSLGFATVIISNQSGVARGMFDEQVVQAVNRKLDQLLQASNRAAVIDRHEFCPFHPEGTVEQYKQESELRKPKPGMIISAANKLALDLDRSWVIGDAGRDIEAGKAAGCRTILLQPQGIATSPAAAESASSPPDAISKTLKEAIDFVAANLRRPDDGEAAGAPKAPALEESNSPVTAAAPGLEQLAEQILDELRKSNERVHYPDFSVSKLLAGIVQVIAVALLFLSYLFRNDISFQQFILFGVFFQVMTIALLIMGKER
jgi:D-glycero-D-manno-heptose 1,7-bisphosphate phosphatase